MHSLLKDMEELREQLEKGSLQRSYQALISYMMRLRTYFQKTYPEFGVSGFYQGYFDMTYFALVPPSFKDRGLKVAIVFNYDGFRFEVWLSGRNRKVLRQYWALFKDSQWPEYRVVAPAKGIDSIVEYDVASGFDLDDQAALTSRIELAALAFIDDVEGYLSERQPV
ncbi:DUF7000 family protein [Chloroflexota bacterium]